jgi:hypothetical protein
VIADIGGGRGHLLRAIVRNTAGSRGILFDQPQVVAEAEPAERLTHMAGDFFKGALPEADLYLLMHIIHDWADPEAIQILRMIRAAAPAKAKLLVIEMIVPPTPVPHPALALDIVMLAVTGGRERSQTQYRDLLESAGWRLDRVLPLPTALSVIEATPR